MAINKLIKPINQPNKKLNIMKNNIEKFVYDKLKLVRWVQDGFPPINLNEQVSHLVELVNTFCLIRKENEELKAKLETYKKDYESMVAEVLRLSRENSKMLEK